MNPGPVLLFLAFAARVHSVYTLPLHPPPLLIPSTPCVFFLRLNRSIQCFMGEKQTTIEKAVYNTRNLFRILKSNFGAVLS